MNEQVAASYARWMEHFSDVGLQADIIDAYEPYVRRLCSLNLPVIFEFDHLCSLLGRTDAYLASVINAPQRHYRVFEIPKRRGGKRTIEAPYPALLQCQQWINREILARVPVDEAAHGFVKGRSILTNASRHVGQTTVLKMDIENFFPSISFRRVIAFFQKIGYAHNVAFYLSRICCRDDHLSQGAATSPALANIIARVLDIRLHALARRHGLRYTRYADDLTFSGGDIGGGFIEYVSRIIKEAGFQARIDKTRLFRGGQKCIVAGIDVAQGRMRVPRDYRRLLRQEVFHLADKGLVSHTAKKKIRDPLYLDSIYGKLCFWKMVEPDCAFVLKYMPIIREMCQQG